MATLTVAALAPTGAGQRSSHAHGGPWAGRIATILGLLLGVVILLYPVGVTYYNNWHAHVFAQRHLDAARGADADVDGEALAAARRYNAALSATSLTDPWGENHESGPEYRAYSRLLGGPADAFAVVRVPRIKVELPLFHGTSSWALARGAGHMFGTSLPVGGEGTHAAIAAHRGMRDRTMFDRLPELVVGDVFFVDVAGETLAYRVTRTDLVLPDDLSLLSRVDGQDLVTLITCAPYSVNTHRLLVTGTRVPWSEVDDSLGSWHGFDWTIQGWMWTRIHLTLATIALIILLIVLWLRGDRREELRAHRAEENSADWVLDELEASDAGRAGGGPAPPERGSW